MDGMLAPGGCTPIKPDDTDPEWGYCVDYAGSIGDTATITVYDLVNQCDALQLPVASATYGVCISPDSLCFTDGTTASMYGRGGTEYGWLDPPSFDVVYSLILNRQDLPSLSCCIAPSAWSTRTPPSSTRAIPRPARRPRAWCNAAAEARGGPAD